MTQVNFGATIKDIATLTGLDSPTGTIVFKLYGPCNYGCSGTPIFTSDPVTVAGNGDYESPSFEPTCVGRFHWVAEYSGDSNNNPESGMCADSREGIDVLFPGCSVLLSTDNGYIIKRIAANTWCVVWCGEGADPALNPIDHSAFNSVISFGSPQVGINHPETIATFVNYMDQAGIIIYSQTGGDVWHSNRPKVPAGYSGDNGPDNLVAKDGASDNPNVDNDGKLWVVASHFSGPSVIDYQGLLRTTSAIGGDYEELFDANSVLGSVPNDSVFIADNYFWWINNKILHRCNYDGSNHNTWDLTADLSVNIYTLNGYPGTNRLIGWRWDTTATPILTIDITNPLSPTWIVTASDPFNGERTGDIVPVTNTLIIATSVNSTLGQGSIWRSTDAGLTWIKVVGPTANLNSPLGANEINAISINPSDQTEVWAAICPPYIYHSTDSGISFSLETVDLSIFDITPGEWTGIAAICNGSIGPTRRRGPFVTLIGAT